MSGKPRGSGAAKSQSTGRCLGCAALYPGPGMRRHLAACPKRTVGETSMLDLQIRAGPYWIFVEAASDARLVDLDRFLRKLWLECCGHLSRFDIAGCAYDVYPGDHFDVFGGARPKSMKSQLGSVLRPGLKFSYEYDFGSTTGLDLEVLGERRGVGVKRSLALLARNDPPKIPCGSCSADTNAIEYCTECGRALCKGCNRKHRCDPDLRLPLVNSPRAGVCGYTGPESEREP